MPAVDADVVVFVLKNWILFYLDMEKKSCLIHWSFFQHTTSSQTLKAFHSSMIKQLKSLAVTTERKCVQHVEAQKTSFTSMIIGLVYQPDRLRCDVRDV